MATEEWRPVVGYEGLYEVSNIGRVKSLPRSRVGIGRNQFDGKESILHPIARKGGYICLNLCDGKGNRKDEKLHRLVAKAFIENPNDYPQINHKDENKANNCVENLEWCTAAYNNNYGTKNQRASKSHRGKKHTITPKLRASFDAKKKTVVGTSAETGEEIVLSCARDGEIFGFSRVGIYHTATGRQNTHKGYAWRYV